MCAERKNSEAPPEKASQSLNEIRDELPPHQ